MILIVLAIIILVVSFVIALVSLVREQKATKDSADGQKAPEIEVTLKPKKPSAKIEATPQVQSKAREPFPWEEDFRSPPRQEEDFFKLPANQEEPGVLTPNKGTSKKESERQLGGEISLKEIIDKSQNS